jgi:anti-sigma-K factor RskA
MMAHSDDHIMLAAEYALGTLDPEERAEAESTMSVDKDLAALVQVWEYSLGPLNQMVGSVEPRPEVWDNIRTAIGLEPQAPLVLPEVAAAPAAPPPAASTINEPIAAGENANVIRLSGEARRWRNVAAFASTIAAALVAMLAVGVYQPDLLPGQLRPKPKTQVAEVKTAPAPAAVPRAAQYVAVLQGQGGGPAFILTVDGASRNFTVRKLDAQPEAGKSFELWLISDKLPRPRSLGVIGAGDFTARPVLASYDSDIVNNATYAVTIEQAGGSPDGNPHSAPVYTGKLVEAVPPAAPASGR